MQSVSKKSKTSSTSGAGHPERSRVTDPLYGQTLPAEPAEANCRSNLSVSAEKSAIKAHASEALFTSQPHTVSASSDKETACGLCEETPRFTLEVWRALLAVLRPLRDAVE